MEVVTWLNGNGEHCEMINRDACVRYEQSQSWFSLNLQPESIRSVMENASKWLGATLKQQPSERPTVGFWLSTIHLRSRRSGKCGLEDSAVRYGQEKKKKLWVNMAVCIHLPLSPFVSVCLSHTYRDLTPFINKVWVLYNQVLRFLPFITAI